MALIHGERDPGRLAAVDDRRHKALKNLDAAVPVTDHSLHAEGHTQQVVLHDVVRGIEARLEECFEPFRRVLYDP